MTRGETGRTSSGPRADARRLTEDKIAANRDFWLAQPRSPERVKNLTRCRQQMASIRNRVEK